MFLYSFRSQKKYLLLKTFFEKTQCMTISEIANLLNCHTITAKSIIEEMNSEAGKEILKKNGKVYIIYNENAMLPHNYYCFLAKKDKISIVLQELLFTSNGYTLESLSKKLYISKSSLYSIIKHINFLFSELNINFHITVNKKIEITSNSFTLMSIIFELLLQQKENINNLIIENVTKNIYMNFGIKEDIVNKEYYQLWLKSFIYFKYLKKKSTISIVDEMRDSKGVDMTFFKDQIKKLNIFLPNTEITKFDCELLLSGLYFSSHIVVNTDKNKKLFDIYVEIFGNVVEKSFSVIEKELFEFFEIDSNSSEHIYFQKSLLISLINFKLYKLRFSEHVNSQMFSLCPQPIKSELLKLSSFSIQRGIFSSKQEIEIFINIVWFLFSKSEKPLDQLLNKKIVVKSILGAHREKMLKKQLINILFFNEEAYEEETLYIVDDDRLLDKSSIRIENFVRMFNELY